MARVNTTTTYDVELDEDDKQLLNAGKRVIVQLPDGNEVRISPPGGDINSRAEQPSSGVEAGSDDDVGLDEIEEMVEKTERENTPAPNGGNTEEETEGNPAAGGMIDIERADGSEE